MTVEMQPMGPEAWSEQEQRMRALVEGSLDLITVASPDLTILHQSEAAQRLLGYSPEELIGRGFDSVVDDGDLERLRSACAEAIDGIVGRPLVLRLRRHDGGLMDGETLVRFDTRDQCLVLATRDESHREHDAPGAGNDAKRQAVLLSVGARALSGRDLRELMRAAVTQLANVLDAEFVAILGQAPKARMLSTWAACGEDPYADIEIWCSNDFQPGHALLCNETVTVFDWAQEHRFHEAEAVIAKGVASAIAVPIPGHGGADGVIVAHDSLPGRFGEDDIVMFEAVANMLATARTRLEDEELVREQALYDPATGLPNLTLFEDRAARALASAQRHGRRMAVMFMELDRVKLVKEGLGHASADKLLAAFGKRVIKYLRTEDTLARVGGDAFAVLLPELGRDEDAVIVVNRINEALRKPLRTGGHDIVTGVAVGIAFNRGVADGEDVHSLLRDADLAMHVAKEHGPGSWEFFEPRMHDAALRQLELTSDLFRALDEDQFEVYFQPIVSLGDEAIVGMEALMRWNHPRHGLLAPGLFMPIAEETGLMVPIGLFVMRTACRTVRDWQLSGLAGPKLSISVNLGPSQLLAPQLPGDVEATLLETGLDPACLILEITEDVLLSGGVLSRLQELKALGVRLAVDDFGTGYSALSHLQHFPIDGIKIDKAFVDGIDGTEDHARLIQGIIQLTHSLGFETVAEGIETSRQAEALREMGSQLGQGFLFARPLPVNDMQALLAMPPRESGGAELAA